MNRGQNALLTKGKRLLAVFLKFVLIISAIPKLQTFVTTYSGHITAADGFKDQQSVNIKGYAELKKNNKEETVENALVMAGLISAYAYDTDNIVLEQEMELVKTSFVGAAEVSLSLFKRIRSLATTNKLALADFGMTPAMLTEYSANVDAVEADLNIPKAAIDQKHFNTSSLEAELEASEVVLNRAVEKLMPQFKKSQPEFFSEFNSANTDTILGSHQTRTPTTPMGNFKMVIRDKNTLDLLTDGLIKVELDEEVYIYKSTKQNIIEEPIGDIKGNVMSPNHKPTDFTGTITNAPQTIEVLMEPLV
ncbi:MAG: hypothetical protein WCL51_14120 [Bacteroidota bacterium]